MPARNGISITDQLEPWAAVRGPGHQGDALNWLSKGATGDSANAVKALFSYNATAGVLRCSDGQWRGRQRVNMHWSSPAPSMKGRATRSREKASPGAWTV
ncbi:hypothetical protein GCM10018779_32220 [Streptomyces griseocarneus]|nr:hypothetical protein GCM10018779_32220 [Streptomyces griseocarneus]